MYPRTPFPAVPVLLLISAGLSPLAWAGDTKDPIAAHRGQALISAAPTIATPLPRPGMGWSTYNFFLAKHNQRLFERMGDAFVASGLRDAGYNTLRVDGGWWGDDSNRRWYYWTTDGAYANGYAYRSGDPHVDPLNYPGGIKGLADAVHQRGLKLGFYLSPALSMGTATNYPANGNTAVQPAVIGLAMIDQHARVVADAGIDHLFFDGYDWSQAQGTEPYVRMFQRLRNEAERVKRPIALSINSGWSWRTPVYADEWRTGRDINGERPVVNECLSTVADPAPGGNGHWSNPDYLMVGFIGDVEAQTQMSLWCVIGAPLYLSHDHRVMSAWDRYVLLNTEAIAINQDPGPQGRRLRADVNGAQVWTRTLQDGSRAVALYNNGSSAVDITVTWAELTVPAGGARVRDLWSHRDLGAFASGFTATAIPAHGCRLLKVSAGPNILPAPPATWAAHPGAKPTYQPLAKSGWLVTGNMINDHARVVDGVNTEATWGHASAGRWMQIDMGSARSVDRVVMEHQAVGAQVWPTTVFAPRTRYRLQGSLDGTAFTTLVTDSLGPAYTLATFPATEVRHLRVEVVEADPTTALGDPTWTLREVHVFNTGAAPKAAPYSTTTGMLGIDPLGDVPPVGLVLRGDGGGLDVRLSLKRTGGSWVPCLGIIGGALAAMMVFVRLRRE